MTKNDLKTGMLCQCKNYVYLLVNNWLISKDTWDDLDNYNDDLTSDFPELAIIAVSKVLTESDLFPKNWNAQMVKDNLLWERKEVKETIKIGEVTYDKAEFEQAVKNLKQINK